MWWLKREVHCRSGAEINVGYPACQPTLATTRPHCWSGAEISVGYPACQPFLATTRPLGHGLTEPTWWMTWEVQCWSGAVIEVGHRRHVLTGLTELDHLPHSYPYTLASGVWQLQRDRGNGLRCVACCVQCIASL